jgi:hypothetical protein
MFVGDLEIATNNFTDEFASFFNMKIKKLAEEVRIDYEVYNGNKKVNAGEFMFLDTPSIKHCLLSLKNKNSKLMD